MPKEKREISKEDIMPFDVYTKNRKELRKNIVDFKKDRRVALGPYATFYFESYETMLAQVQEMLYIEKGGEEQLKDELAAYNPLVPNGKELTATLMFEIDNPVSRAAFLGKVGGIEEKVFMKVGKRFHEGLHLKSYKNRILQPLGKARWRKSGRNPQISSQAKDRHSQQRVLYSAH